MSLLNDMLQDLSKIEPARSAIFQAPLLSQQKDHTGLLTKIFLSVAGALLFSGAIWMFWPKHIKLSAPRTVEPVRLVSEIAPVPVFPLASWIASLPKAPQAAPAISDSLLPVTASVSDAFSPDTAHKASDEYVLAHEEMNFPTRDAWSDEQLNNALEAIQDGNDPRAMDLLEQVLTRIPASVEARENLAALYLSHSELARAYDLLDEGLKLDPHNLRLTIMKCRLLIEEGQQREALALLEKFNPDINKVPEYYAMMAAIFEALNRMNEAGSIYQALIKVDPAKGQY